MAGSDSQKGKWLMQRFRWAAAVGILFVFCPFDISSQENDSETYRQLNLFGEVFERVRVDYVEKVSDAKLIESAINGMLTSLDPHSSFLNEKNFRDMQVQTKGEFGGLGIEVTMESGLVMVVSPIDDTPAFRAGIKTGDLISQLDGEPVLGLTLAEAVDRMRGRVGTDIKLTIHRESQEPFDVTITRAIIRIQSVRSRIEKNIGYVRITTFNERAEEALYEAMDDLRDELNEDMLGVVLDLRNNPGGLLDQALAVSDAFLGEGEIVSTRSRDVSRVRRFTAERGDISEGKPVVVLINGGSASASEIVAGALQDHDRALIMGNRSFGKGSVQTIIPVSGGGALRLTTARYYTPDGRSIQRTGIRPDIRAESGDDERRREADLENALEGGVETAAVVQRNMAEVCPNLLEDAEDPTLTCALDILESRRIFAGRLQE